VGAPFDPRRLSEKIEVIGPRVDLDRLTKSINVEIVDRIGSSWDERFGLLVRFKSREGHCNVPHNLVEAGDKLGHWVLHQRQIRTKLSAERRQRLNSIGFILDVLDGAWEEGFAALKIFKSREGHCRVPHGCIEGTFKLGSWVSRQRNNRETMPAERRQRLDAIGFVWNVLESAWEEGFAALKTFKSREGHCRVPISHVEGTFMLGTWVFTQRQRLVSAERKKRLDEIGFVWDPRDSDWEEGLSALKTFMAREGHCRVRTKHVEGSFKLGTWVDTQRQKKDKMPVERKRRLDDIGFVWDVLEGTWEEGLAALKAFKARGGHCRVPAKHIDGTFRLGQWVDIQRQNKGTMSAERRGRLDEIGFVWDALETKWETGLAALKRFKAREGHCRVPDSHVEGTFRLGRWARHQRKIKETMPAQHRQRLDEIGMVWGGPGFS
jgi:hypothetical protein